MSFNIPTQKERFEIQSNTSIPSVRTLKTKDGAMNMREKVSAGRLTEYNNLDSEKEEFNKLNQSIDELSFDTNTLMQQIKRSQNVVSNLSKKILFFSNSSARRYLHSEKKLTKDNLKSKSKRCNPKLKMSIKLNLLIKKKRKIYITKKVK